MKHQNYIAGGLSGALALFLFLLSPQTAFAQDDDAETLEEVVVTGSRIRQNPLDAQTPVQIGRPPKGPL